MGRGAVVKRTEVHGTAAMLVYGNGETLGLEDSEVSYPRFGKQRAIMDFTAEKKESENNNANNPENAHQTLDASSQLASTLDSSNKETKEQQSHELKAGLYPLKTIVIAAQKSDQVPVLCAGHARARDFFREAHARARLRGRLGATFADVSDPAYLTQKRDGVRVFGHLEAQFHGWSSWRA
ncbi:hypothetical protein LR48_Vigan06g064500 [Vigna angularis]|uniref:Uncharacterized protein n=1 Tax=Phaseolus angularis TaxID=3914 RepID=A0A0L9US16_PHAAN|nr:hypothetical protein LR48_Vigan06g064500 [Vigna angularis]